MPPPPLPHPDFSHVSTFSNIPNCTDSIWGRSPRVASSTSPSSFLSLPPLSPGSRVSIRDSIDRRSSNSNFHQRNAKKDSTNRFSHFAFRRITNRNFSFFYSFFSVRHKNRIESNRNESPFPERGMVKIVGLAPNTFYEHARVVPGVGLLCVDLYPTALSLSLSLRVVAGSLSSSPPGLPL